MFTQYNMSIFDFKMTRDEFYKQILSKSNSKNSVRASKTGLIRWDNFLASIGYTDAQAIKELKGQENNPDTYLFINKFVQYQVKIGLKKSTISLSLAVLKSWLASNGVMLHSEYAKRFVKLPKQLKELKQPLTAEIIRKLIDEASPQLKPILLSLVSSGMRISECLQVQKRDINVNSNPIEIRLRAETTKTREERIAFISSEAWQVVKPRLEGLGDRETVFTKQYNEFSLPGIELRFNRLREKTGLTQKYENVNRYHVHIHNFRAYFHTQATKVLGGDIAHAILGHHKYLDQYFRLTAEEKTEMYHKLEPYLTVSNEVRQKAMLDDKDRQLSEMEVMKEELAKQKAKIKRLENIS